VTDADVFALSRVEAGEIYHAMYLAPFDGVTDPARVQSFIKSVRTRLLAPVASGEA
jgi:hypothetical protein